MGDFDDFAAGMQSDHADKQRKHDERLQREAAERDAQWNAGKEYLEREVMPILANAKEAFAKQGHRVEIKPNWNEGAMYIRPQITFQVFSQKKRPYDTSTYEVSGNVANIWHENDEVTATISDKPYSNLPGHYKATGLDAVKEVAKRALQTLYGALDPKD